MSEPMQISDMIEHLDEIWNEASVGSFEERVSMFALSGLKLGLTPKRIAKNLKRVTPKSDYERTSILGVLRAMGISLIELISEKETTVEEPKPISDMIEDLEKIWTKTRIGSFEERASMFALTGLKLGLTPKRLVKCLRHIHKNDREEAASLLKTVHAMGMTLGDL